MRNQALVKNSIQGDALYNALVAKFETRSDAALAGYFGASAAWVNHWKSAKTKVSPEKIASWMSRLLLTTLRDSHKRSIFPIVEFFPIQSKGAVKGAGSGFLPNKGRGHSLYKGVADALGRAKGIYIFYDSRGRALYVGKAKRLMLYKEMLNAFNRELRTQKIVCIDHPERQQAFLPGWEKLCRPLKTQKLLSEMAAYFSAYAVHPDMIDDVEALLVRGFPNDLLNIKMERFKHSKPRKGVQALLG